MMLQIMGPSKCISVISGKRNLYYFVVTTGRRRPICQ